VSERARAMLLLGEALVLEDRLRRLLLRDKRVRIGLVVRASARRGRRWRKANEAAGRDGGAREGG
jgi:hypothetical protein